MQCIFDIDYLVIRQNTANVKQILLLSIRFITVRIGYSRLSYKVVLSDEIFTTLLFESFYSFLL